MPVDTLSYAELAQKTSDAQRRFRIDIEATSSHAPETFAARAAEATWIREVDPRTFDLAYIQMIHGTSLAGEPVYTFDQPWELSHRGWPVAEILLQTAQRLRQLAELAPDWDSYDAAPPSALAIAMASQLLATAGERFGAQAGERLSPFAIAPIPDGGVHIEWRAPAREIEVDVGPEGQLGYLFIEGRGDTRRFREAENVSLEVILELVGRTLLRTPAA
jgi:hypothetical protein